MFTALVTLAAVAATLVTFTIGLSIESANATIIEKDRGASGFAPREDPKAPGWDPNQAEEDAPGQIIGPDEPGESREFAPGEQGLEAGIIGPD